MQFTLAHKCTGASTRRPSFWVMAYVLVPLYAYTSCTIYDLSP